MGGNGGEQGVQEKFVQVNNERFEWLINAIHKRL